MLKEIILNVNKHDYQVVVKESESLLDVLRKKIYLTGAKLGCNEGECGSCIVIVDDKAVNSCLILACELVGAKIETIEGVAQDNKLHPLQQAFIDAGAIQCGFCTAGMIMSSLALFRHNLNPTHQEIEEALAGNLCRCTGYYTIIEALQQYQKVLGGDLK